MQVQITRTRKNDDGTFGYLSLANRSDFACLTLERPDYNHDGIIGNEKGNSCIPEGTYRCFRRKSDIVARCYKHLEKVKENPFNPVGNGVMAELLEGETFEIEGANCGESEGERTAVLFHPGNTKDDLKGCVALGSNIGIVNNKNGIINSKETFTHFMTVMYGVNEFQLVVVYEPNL